MSKITTLDALDIESLPSPNTLKKELPASPKEQEFIHEKRKEIARILNGEDPRLLLVAGPCSIHHINAAKEYALKLKQLAEEVSSSFLIVMRAYFEKPRTTIGWKGLLYDPHLNESHDIQSGLRQARELLLYLAKNEIPAATEFLDPIAPRFFGDLISWACIGARTSESQIHRQFASGLAMPAAFKNSTSGNVEVAINGVLSARMPHAFFGIDDNGHVAIIRTKGNPNAHIVLRGGENKPNYDPDSLRSVCEQFKEAELKPKILIDCSHDNSRRNHEEQIPVFKSILHQFQNGHSEIKGLILESNLLGGQQQINKTKLHHAISLTDPCLDWPSTEKLILWGDAKIRSQIAQDKCAQI